MRLAEAVEALQAKKGRSWQDEARGIPVWVGARAVTPSGGSHLVLWAHWSVESAQGDSYDEPMAELYDLDDPIPQADLVPDLNHADTRTAFVRRLAIRLGCPEATANRGVLMWPSDGTYDVLALVLTAGGHESDGRTSAPEGRGVWRVKVPLDREAYTDAWKDGALALVRAWRSVQDG